MAEAQAGPAGPGQAATAPEGLTPKQMEQLTEIVYRLLKEDVLRNRERRGDVLARRWR